MRSALATRIEISVAKLVCIQWTMENIPHGLLPARNLAKVVATTTFVRTSALHNLSKHPFLP
jgi:hypothetical protein